MSSTLLGVPELAQALSIDQSTIHRRIARGELTPYTVVGNRPVFRVEDVDSIAQGLRTLHLPDIGSFWRFKSSQKVYKVREARMAFGGLVSLQAMDTGANTSLALADFAKRCVAVETNRGES